MVTLPNVGAVIALLVLMLATTTFVVLYVRRQRLYAVLSAQQDALASGASVEISHHAYREGIGFEQGFAQLTNIVDDKTFHAIAAEAAALSGVERSYVPTHKKGGTIAYETLIAQAPTIVQLYTSQQMRDAVSNVVGMPVRPTPINDQSSLSLLIYDRPGDHIDWHYDHNFYRGRHFTVLLPIVNRGCEPGSLSSTRFQIKHPDSVSEFATPPNGLLIFEGAKVLHRATPLAAGERRIVLSMTYCSDPRSSWWQGIARRLKDTAFFGIRALWT